MSLDSRLQRIWYGKSVLASLLLPLACLFYLIVALRRCVYRIGLFRSRRVSKPVIVVGNITVGGTGKTPLTLWLADALRTSGHRVGIVMRGYGGVNSASPCEVSAESDPLMVGDEAVLAARSSDAIVVVCRDRVAAANRAIELGASVILSDDGLQHYALARDLEIAVVDGSRGLGNRWLLPAGPLREPASRLRSVDIVAVNARGEGASGELRGVISYRLEIVGVRSLASGQMRALESFRQTPVHAVAAIGNPEAFFDGLRAAGLNVDARALPDHAVLGAEDLRRADRNPVLMTEKDAVKCRAFADQRLWAVIVKVVMSDADQRRVLDALNARTLAR